MSSTPTYPRILLPLLLLLTACNTPNPLQTVHVAVAANFQAIHHQLAQRFYTDTGIHITQSPGATGALYAQIRNGAPYQIFLAADTERPALLEANDNAVAGTRFTYALGQLALLTVPGAVLEDGATALKEGRFTHLALANPETAPYGTAAIEVLKKLGVWEHVQAKIVLAENVGQAYQYVASGAAELAFVARSYLQETPASQYWIVPENLHASIRQDAVLLLPGAENEDARRYLAFLRSAEAHDIITAAGYGWPE